LRRQYCRFSGKEPTTKERSVCALNLKGLWRRKTAETAKGSLEPPMIIKLMWAEIIANFF